MKKIKMLFKWSKPYILLLIAVVAFQMLIPLTYSYVPQFTKYIFDYVLENTGKENTLPKFLIEFFQSYSGIKAAGVVAITLIVFQTLRAAMMFLSRYVKSIFAENISKDIRISLFKHVQDLKISRHNNLDTGDMIQRSTSDVDTIRQFLSEQFPEIFYIFTTMIAGSIQMAIVNVGITFVTLIIIPVTVVSSIIFFKFITKQFAKVEVVEANMSTAIQENINGVRVVKAFNTEIDEIKNFKEKSKAFVDESLKVNKGMAYYWGISDGLCALQYAATIFYCIYLAEFTNISVGDIVVCVSYISMMIYPIRNLGRIIGDFGKSIVAAGRIEEVLNEEDEYVVDGTEDIKVKGNIEFKDVTFKFDDSDKYLLNGLTFSIKQGESVAIIGKTGSGKSTIASLLVRMHEYNGGSIKIDGVELKDIKKKSIRENIGIILQDPFLYARSVYDNVKIARPKSTKEQIYSATKKAAIHDDIMTFDKQYDTLVGEKGVTLSGGQKQRLAIARMLLLNKPVIIFDDSLSAVDASTDMEIRKTIQNSGSDITSIIITHRITTAKEADKIIVIEDGKVSEIGTHEELAVKEGLYKTLWDIQGALEEEFLKLVEKEVQANG